MLVAFGLAGIYIFQVAYKYYILLLRPTCMDIPVAISVLAIQILSGNAVSIKVLR